MKILLLLLVSVPAFGVSVEFSAIGKPSMLRIHGTCMDASMTKIGNVIKAKVKLDSCDTGIPLRNRHMKEKYLETAKFPNATLVANLSGASFTGELSVHGKVVVISGDVDDKSLKFSTKISNFGMDIPSFLGVTVADEVKVQGNF